MVLALHPHGLKPKPSVSKQHRSGFRFFGSIALNCRPKKIRTIGKLVSFS